MAPSPAPPSQDNVPEVPTPARPREVGTEKTSSVPWLEWTALLVLISGIMGAYFFVPAVQQSAQEAFAAVASGEDAQIRAWADSLGVWGPLTILALQLLQVVLAVIPALPLMILSVLGYGPLWGGLLAWGGLLLACAFGYWIGRTFGQVAVDRFVKPRTARSVQDFVERYGAWAIVAARFSPLFPADAVSFVAGLSRLGFRRYLLASAVGTLPVTLLLIFLGSDVKRLLGGLVVASLLVLVLFSVYVVRDRRRLRNGALPQE
ncbi:TVP38/TMEM64 family protein [Deinococcus peraridilitoris]|nr:VTT domain-containing protein [Deinococcus peraridilitoris]